ncbi:MAG: hypothetical protein ACFFBD_05550 [Candidatus Hodarchaeota archaeon]
MATEDQLANQIDFIAALLTPITLISGFLLAVTFYLVDVELSGGSSFSISLEISVFVIFFIISLIALDLVVSALVMSKIRYGRMVGEGSSVEGAMTILGFIAFIITTLGVSYLVPVISYGLIGYVTQGRTVALASTAANAVAYAIPLVLGFLRRG